MNLNDNAICSADIRDYWSVQAQAFYELSLAEWNSTIHWIWDSILKQYFHFEKGARILEVGCGPGLISMILAEQGYCVTAVDINPDMLLAGKRLAQELHLSDRIQFLEMDAQVLSFKDGEFNGVISRNVMWVLEKPETAYREWLRVVKENGVCVVIDANWYLHLFDSEYQGKMEQGLQHLKEAGYPLRDERHTEEYDAFVRELPLSKKHRPSWDRALLESGLCRKVEIVPKLPAELYEEYYQILYENIPTFLIRAMK